MSSLSASGNAVPAGWDCHVHVFEDGAALDPSAHYRPTRHPLSAIEALAAEHGCGHLVLVQPSVYGVENRILLEALWASGGRHRGVVVLAGNETAADLAGMNEVGVRGIRFNLVSPAGSGHADAERQLHALGPMLRDLDWHVQWYAPASALPQLAGWQKSTGLRFVLDHLAGIGTRVPMAGAHWDALGQLARTGAWVKLSGWYRLDAPAPYASLHDRIRAVAARFEDRVVWGSDWPHTSFEPQALPAYASLWEPAVAALGAESALAVACNGARLYA